MTATSTAAVRRRLLDWYRRAARDLPWRRSRDPYRVWVSEVMLQQTTVRAVVPYYERFVERYPTVAALAAASEEDVLAAWSGLGYYHRARNLLRGARHVAAHHEGRFPATLEAALAVPGVGLYTASAILSIAHGVALPVVDGNVRRVLSRLYALRGAKWQKDAPYYIRADEVLDRDSPGDWNQAVMELGATICLPRRPACPVCPLRSACRAARTRHPGPAPGEAGAARAGGRHRGRRGPGERRPLPARPSPRRPAHGADVGGARRPRSRGAAWPTSPPSS